MSGKTTIPTPPRGKVPPVPARSTPTELVPTKNGATDEDAIRSRAYALWEEAGHPEGDGIEFWLRAEQELKKR